MMASMSTPAPSRNPTRPRNQVRASREAAFTVASIDRNWAWTKLSPYAWRAEHPRTGLKLTVWPGTLRLGIHRPGGHESFRKFDSIEELIKAVDATRKAGEDAACWKNTAEEDMG